ncbi:1-phosphatidylinositol 4,5-bisphosphate phosphodiesterase zeta-1-like [Polyodon spathula]|uniref:1-phosphatidylinositol 4,5-bisphosphate phosphodiesterase zeta-1-like n=1 Tax=Polyodon spathula TaxID=7913 RepID=UPI001B7DD65A|nr:1-phosphatidylinositol 4,5-bisphosphate phosphodiesterase zeta-1-like [Polyodon spathula]
MTAKGKGKALSRRDDIKLIFSCYAPRGKNLSAQGLLDFIQKEQMNSQADMKAVEQIIENYEINKTVKAKKSMTFGGFLRYMESEDCSVNNKDHNKVYHDMDWALCHYFISSSHNTYLIGDQLVGRSHLHAYVSALRRGCRCLEIDCWDGPDQEPVVYHGYTLTSKILFKEVIATIEQHAFEVSSYPVILSLENHCTPLQQEMMAEYLKTILGEKLLDMTINDTFAKELPSPEELKNKILIKNKKIGLLQDTILKKGTNRHGEVGHCIEDDDDEEEAEEETAKCKSPNSRLTGEKKIALAMALSDLVIYTKSIHFVSFKHSIANQKFYENTSLAEAKARKLAMNSGAKFVLHNMKFITRIYPAGSRALSSNYNPQEFWNVGAQMVALNFQSLGEAMDLNRGKFQDNGNCGYILKPHFMRVSEKPFDPNAFQPDFKPTNLLVKVISGYSLPVPRGSKGIDPYVRVEIHGVSADNVKKQTNYVKKNAMNPRWDEIMTFAIQVPDLALVRFIVEDQNAILANEFIAQYTLHLTSMNPGYRWVPLLSKEGISLDPASLFIYVWFS